MAPINNAMAKNPHAPFISCHPLDTVEGGARFPVFLVSGKLGAENAGANDNERDEQRDCSANSPVED